jgi:hypothetical protein
LRFTLPIFRIAAVPPLRSTSAPAPCFLSSSAFLPMAAETPRQRGGRRHFIITGKAGRAAPTKDSPMRTRRRYRDDINAAAFYEHGLLRDGHVARFTFRDSQQARNAEAARIAEALPLGATTREMMQRGSGTAHDPARRGLRLKPAGLSPCRCAQRAPSKTSRPW